MYDVAAVSVLNKMLDHEFFFVCQEKKYNLMQMKLMQAESEM